VGIEEEKSRGENVVEPMKEGGSQCGCIIKRHLVLGQNAPISMKISTRRIVKYHSTPIYSLTSANFDQEMTPEPAQSHMRPCS
jgi:hypothetical protein